jgi:hypothetical protein
LNRDAPGRAGETETRMSTGMTVRNRSVCRCAS